MSYLKRVCDLLGENIDDVVNYRVEGDEVVLVVCHGIRGNPKYRIPLSDLPELEPEGPEPEVTDSARELADEYGLDLLEITGTGHDGRVLVRDVRNAMGGEA